MDDRKTPEELPGDTRSVIEQLSDESPSVYLAKLRAMLRPDNGQPMSLLPYLQKDPVPELISQRQTPKKWLENLTKVGFTDPASILDLRLDLVEYNVGEFALCTDSKDTFTVSPNPGAMSVDYTPVLKDSDVHPGLLSLEFVDGSDNLSVPEHDETAKSSGVNQTLPSLVLPIGQLSKGYTTESGLKVSDETNYVLVVDAVASARPVWLIFDRMLVFEDDKDDKDDRDDEEEDIHPDTVDLVFNGTEKNFYAAQVLPSIQDWFQFYDKLSFTRIRDSFQKTGLTGKVKARVVTAEDASVLWNKDTSVDKNK